MINDEELTSLLKNAKTIAVVGCSTNPEKTAHRIPRYLQNQGYRIIPVNPHAETILGEKVYRSLAEIPIEIDVVDVFRPGFQCLAVVEEAVKLNPKLIFLQLGIRNDEARQVSEKHNIPFVQDRCLMVAHRNLRVGKIN